MRPPDRLLFATTAQTWTAASRTLVNDVIRDFDKWGPLGPPQVKFVAGLGESGAEGFCR